MRNTAVVHFLRKVVRACYMFYLHERWRSTTGCSHLCQAISQALWWATGTTQPVLYRDLYYCSVVQLLASWLEHKTKHYPTRQPAILHVAYAVIVPSVRHVFPLQPQRGEYHCYTAHRRHNAHGRSTGRARNMPLDRKQSQDRFRSYLSVFIQQFRATAVRQDERKTVHQRTS